MIDKIKSLCDSYVLFVVKNNRPFVLGKSGKFYQKLPKFNFEYNYEDKVSKTIDTILEYHNKLYLEGIHCSIVSLLDFWNNNLNTIIL